ncbi:MAG: SCP2 sterol-binding domain-containing protein [Sandaracinaceae bacterium]|nr:SCP2 sterol-binding domain-containing protein [Sandaracinaceae bacterium]
MAKDPLSFLREDFVALFNRGVSDLSQKATAGEAWAKARLEDVRAASGCAHFVLDGAGGGEVYLEIQNGEMKAHAQKPASPPTRLGVGGSAATAQAGLEMLLSSGHLDDASSAVRVTRIASGKLEKLIEKEKLSFQLTVKDVPEVDQVVVRVGLGFEDPPVTPGFSMTVSYDDLEDVRNGDLKPQQLFMSKIKIVGDASRAMTLAMTLMQQRR